MRRAAREPQDIYVGDKLVARVVSPDRGSRKSPTAAELLANIQHACTEENYSLEIPPRTAPRLQKRRTQAKRSRSGRA